MTRSVAKVVVLVLALWPMIGWSHSSAAFEGPKAKLRGFGTLGVAYQPSAGAEFLRDITQPDGVRNSLSADVDTRLGVQLDLTLAPRWDATFQAVTRYRYDGSYRPELAWGFVRYTPVPDLEIRAGRLGWDVYMLSDSRDVGYSYLWVRPPVEYYGHLQLSKLNGADVVWRRPMGQGVLSSKLFAGEVESRIPLDKRSYSDLSDSWLYGGYLDFHTMAWQFRFGLTRLELSTELRGDAGRQLRALGALDIPGLAELLDASSLDTTFDFFTLGAAYAPGALQAQAMYSHTRAAQHRDMRSGYVSLGYRIERWTPYVYLAAVRPVGSPPASPLTSGGGALPGFSDAFADVSGLEQHTLAAGVRYDFMANAALKLQVDRVRVRDADKFLLLWRNQEDGWNGRATVFSATLDFMF